MSNANLKTVTARYYVCRNCGATSAPELTDAGKNEVIASLLEACEKAYELIATGHYHNSPVADALAAAIAKATGSAS